MAGLCRGPQQSERHARAGLRQSILWSENVCCLLICTVVLQENTSFSPVFVVFLEKQQVHALWYATAKSAKVSNICKAHLL